MGYIWWGGGGVWPGVCGSLGVVWCLLDWLGLCPVWGLHRGGGGVGGSLWLGVQWRESPAVVGGVSYVTGWGPPSYGVQ